MQRFLMGEVSTGTGKEFVADGRGEASQCACMVRDKADEDVSGDVKHGSEGRAAEEDAVADDPESSWRDENDDVDDQNFNG